ncbi:MAG: hypothetical protein CMO40_04545 [Verrucomicrobiaceae bacterium]|nr:hypothetical protein [Verrucomicrobiaceae bacterium]
MEELDLLNPALTPDRVSKPGPRISGHAFVAIYTAFGMTLEEVLKITPVMQNWMREPGSSWSGRVRS